MPVSNSHEPEPPEVTTGKEWVNLTMSSGSLFNRIPRLEWVNSTMFSVTLFNRIPQYERVN